MAPRKSTKKKKHPEDEGVKSLETRKTRKPRVTQDRNSSIEKGMKKKKPQIIVHKLYKKKNGKPEKVIDLQSKRERVLEAIALVNEKDVSVRRAASLCNLSFSYLYRRVTGELDVNRRNGPCPVFSYSEEEEMAKWLLEMAQRRMGLKSGEFLDFTKDLVIKNKKKNPFSNNRPGHEWYHAFLSRNKHIIDPVKYKSLILIPKTSKENTSKCSQNFREFLTSKNLLEKPNQIWSVDECVLGINKTEKKVVGPMKIKSSYQTARYITSQEGEQITALFCCSADDQVMPPFLVYPRPEPHKQNPLKGAIIGTAIHYTKTGSFDEDIFMKYLDHFDKYCGSDRPVCLLVDGVRNFINMSIYQRALQKGIELYGAMPNPVDLMQPIHKGFFGQLTTKWYTVVKQNSRNNQNERITKLNFAQKIKEAYEEFIKRGTLVAVDDPELEFITEDDDEELEEDEEIEEEERMNEKEIDDSGEQERTKEATEEVDEIAEEVIVPVTDQNDVPIPSHYCEVQSNDIQMVEETVTTAQDPSHHILVHSNDIQMIEETVTTVPDPSHQVEIASPSRKKKRKLESLKSLLTNQTTTKHNYSDMNSSHAKAERAREAIAMIKDDKVSIRQAASVCKLSVSYLYRRVKGEIDIDSRNGPPPTLSKFEEEALATWLLQMARQRTGLQPKEVLDFVQKLLKKEKRKTPFVDDRPGYEWYYAFLSRNGHIIDPGIYRTLFPRRDKNPDNKFDVLYTKFRKFTLSNAVFADKYILGVNKKQRTAHIGMDKNRCGSAGCDQGKETSPGSNTMMQTVAIETLKESSAEQKESSAAVPDENEEPVDNQKTDNSQEATSRTNESEVNQGLEEKQSKIDRVLQAYSLIKKDKMSLRQAASKCNLSVSYLYRRYHGEIDIDRRNGPTPVLGKSVEELLAKWLLDMAERRLALLPKEVLDAVQKFVKKEKIETSFVDGKPGYDWYTSFLSRNQHILDPNRYKYLSSVRVKSKLGRLESWNKMFEEFVIMKDLLEKPKQIWNVDECTVDIDNSIRGNVTGNMKTNTSYQWSGLDPYQKKLTTLFCCSADDQVIPPFLVYAKPVPKGDPLNSTLKGTVVEYTTKGWITSDTLLKFIDHFHKYCGSDRPVCLLVDSFRSHIDMEVFNSAKDKGIELYGAMPNIGDLMQPFYRNVFGQLTAKWNKVTERYMAQDHKPNIWKLNFAELLSEAYMDFENQGIDIAHMQITSTDSDTQENLVEMNTTDEEENKERETTGLQSTEVTDSQRRENTALARELSSSSLLSTSDKQHEDSEDAICMVCHMNWVEDQNNVNTWVECSLCRKWIHEDCIPIGIDTSGLEDENEAFFCHNCI